MRYVMFDDFKPGVLIGDSVVDITSLLSPEDLKSQRATVQGIISKHKEIAAKAGSLGKGKSLSSVRLRQPVPDPAQLLCAAKNYKDGHETPKADFFLKANNSIIGPDETVELPAAEARVFHAEPELAVVIGKRADRVKAADAMNYVFGYTCFLDVSARGLSTGFYIHKSFRTFGPMGPTIVTADEVGDPHNLRVRFWNGDALKQDFQTSEMANYIDKLIEAASAVCPLEPGDVIPTGTHHLGLLPIQNGDKLTIEIEKVGRLSVTTKDPLKRAWDPTQRGGPALAKATA